MKFLTTAFLATLLLTIPACSGARENAPSEQAPVVKESGALSSSDATTMNRAQTTGATAPAGGAQTRMVSMVNQQTAEQAPTAAERKIIRNATLTVETDDPAAAQRKIASAAESLGGFVVTSESKQHTRGGEDAKPYEVVTVEVRVPFAQFDALMNEIRATGRRVPEEKITGQDVTEEYIDLEARIRTQKALEAQFMEIMKRADRVADALEVQRQAAEVRGEIERLEGRRRFLENRASLSTIKATLQPPSAYVAASTSGFMHELKEAFGDGVDFAATLLLVLIRLVVALIPVLLFIFLPLGLLARFFIRRRRRTILAERLRQEATTDSQP